MGFGDAFRDAKEKAAALQRGDVIWNMRTGRWEARNSDEPLTWQQRIFGHWGNPAPPQEYFPPQPPAEDEPLPHYDPPGGLTTFQLQRIQQLNDLASRGIITDAVRDQEVRQILSETHR